MLYPVCALQTERDTIEVIAFLKREDAGKEDELGELRLALKQQRQEARLQREELDQACATQVNQLEATLEERNNEVVEGMGGGGLGQWSDRIMKAEINLIKNALL